MQHSVKTTNPHKNYAELLESKLAKLEASCSDITDERAEFETDNDGYNPGVREERKEPRQARSQKKRPRYRGQSNCYSLARARRLPP